MASYGMKYRKIWDNELELQIFQRGYSGPVKEIGDLQALSLQLDGDEDPCKPISKTILSFTLVDTSDIPDTATVKHGGWEEFYTPDSTLYKVCVSVGGEIQWSGYITPDNWTESLDYRGSITITARDNIGHLQDFEWDDSPLQTREDGLLSVKELVTGAIALIEMPMEVEYNYATRSNYICIEYQDQGKDIDSFCINTKACEGESIYDILEKVLSSLGLCLRYTGFNTVCVDYLRYLPYYNATAIMSTNIKFLVGGTKKKVPPYKKIIDTVKYNYEDSVDFDFAKGLNPGTNSNYTGRIYYDSQSSSGNISVNGKAAINNNPPNVPGWSGTGFLDTSGILAPDDIDKDAVYLAANSASNKFVQSYSFGTVRNPNVDIDITIVANMYTQLLYLYKYPNSYLAKVVYSVRYIANGNNYYWNGDVWATTISEVTLENTTSTDNIRISLGNKTSDSKDVPQYGELIILFDGITFRLGAMPNNIFSLYYGVYLAIIGIHLSIPENVNTLEKDTVTTVVDEKYNVIDKRDTDFGPLSKDVEVIMPGNYENALYYRDTIPEPVPYNLHWGDGVSQPFPSIRHKQYLMYHGADEEMLEGDILFDGPYKRMILMDRTVMYKGKRYIILSGTLNLITGSVEGAIMRSYKEYEELWDD